jgi:hypothetical protein
MPQVLALAIASRTVDAGGGSIDASVDESTNDVSDGGLPQASPQAAEPPPPVRPGCAGCATIGADPASAGAIVSLIAFVFAGLRRKSK